jgi:uncharacterized protein (DUF111 family)
MKVLLFHPSAGASGDMIMASLLHLGADLHAVRQAVESVGCRLEVSCQKGAALQPVDGSCPRCLLHKAPDY